MDLEELLSKFWNTNMTPVGLIQTSHVLRKTPLVNVLVLLDLLLITPTTFAKKTIRVILIRVRIHSA